MSTKKLFITTALLEAGAGAAFLAFPSTTLILLLSVPLETAACVTLGRLTGLALLSLGIANWQARNDAQSRAARGIITAMLIYNLGAVIILATAAITSHSSGPLLWPGAILHAAMTIWCVLSLLNKSSTPKT